MLEVIGRPTCHDTTKEVGIELELTHWWQLRCREEDVEGADPELFKVLEYGIEQVLKCRELFRKLFSDSSELLLLVLTINRGVSAYQCYETLAQLDSLHATKSFESLVRVVIVTVVGQRVHGAF